MGVAGLVYGTSSNAFYNVDAALTQPASWNYAFIYNSTQDLFRLTNAAGTEYGWPGFVRLADGVYYEYEWTSVTGHFDDGDSSNDAFDPPQDILPDGLEVQMVFNRSNTTWFAGSGNNTGFYFADDSKIGSDATVGTLEKGTLIIDNQTNRNYLIHIDMSSNTSNVFTRLFYDDYRYNNGNDNTLTFFRTTINRLYIPSFTKFELRHYSASSAYYLDAWYLQDLGVSDSYNEGYDGGYTDGENAVIASGGLQGIIEGVFEGIVAIFGIEIFNGVSLGAVALFPLVITLFVFVMKIVKMGG